MKSMFNINTLNISLQQLNKEDAIYDVIQKMIHSEKNGELNSDPLDQTVRPPTQEHLGGESYCKSTSFIAMGVN